MNNGASSDLNVFPNPTSKNFTLHYSSAYSGELLIRITDLSGREIISKKVVKDTNDLDLEFDTSVYPSGNYFISLNGSGNTIEKRILTIIK